MNKVLARWMAALAVALAGAAAASPIRIADDAGRVLTLEAPAQQDPEVTGRLHMASPVVTSLHTSVVHISSECAGAYLGCPG